MDRTSSSSTICNTVQNFHNQCARLVKLPSLKDKVKMLLNCKIWPCRFAKLFVRIFHFKKKKQIGQRAVSVNPSEKQLALEAMGSLLTSKTTDIATCHF